MQNEDHPVVDDTENCRTALFLIELEPSSHKDKSQVNQLFKQVVEHWTKNLKQVSEIFDTFKVIEVTQDIKKKKKESSRFREFKAYLKTNVPSEFKGCVNKSNLELSKYIKTTTI